MASLIPRSAPAVVLPPQFPSDVFELIADRKAPFFNYSLSNEQLRKMYDNHTSYSEIARICRLFVEAKRKLLTEKQAERPRTEGEKQIRDQTIKSLEYNIRGLESAAQHVEEDDQRIRALVAQTVFERRSQVRQPSADLIQLICLAILDKRKEIKEDGNGVVSLRASVWLLSHVIDFQNKNILRPGFEEQLSKLNQIIAELTHHVFIEGAYAYVPEKKCWTLHEMLLRIHSLKEGEEVFFGGGYQGVTKVDASGKKTQMKGHGVQYVFRKCKDHFSIIVIEGGESANVPFFGNKATDLGWEKITEEQMNIQLLYCLTAYQWEHSTPITVEQITSQVSTLLKQKAVGLGRTHKLHLKGGCGVQAILIWLHYKMAPDKKNLNNIKLWGEFKIYLTEKQIEILPQLKPYFPETKEVYGPYDKFVEALRAVYKQRTERLWVIQQPRHKQGINNYVK